jgi:hypothetical protein
LRKVNLAVSASQVQDRIVIKQQVKRWPKIGRGNHRFRAFVRCERRQPLRTTSESIDSCMPFLFARRVSGWASTSLDQLSSEVT